MPLSCPSLWLHFNLIAAAAPVAGEIKSCVRYPPPNIMLLPHKDAVKMVLRVKIYFYVL
jgi:hypothetical protein